MINLIKPEFLVPAWVIIWGLLGLGFSIASVAPLNRSTASIGHSTSLGEHGHFTASDQARSRMLGLISYACFVLAAIPVAIVALYFAWPLLNLE